MQLDKNDTIAWYDNIENACYDTVANALADCGNGLSDASDVWDVAKTMTEAMLQRFDEIGIDYPEMLDTF